MNGFLVSMRHDAEELLGDRSMRLAVAKARHRRERLIGFGLAAVGLLGALTLNLVL